MKKKIIMMIVMASCSPYHGSVSSLRRRTLQFFLNHTNPSRQRNSLSLRSCSRESFLLPAVNFDLVSHHQHSYSQYTTLVSSACGNHTKDELVILGESQDKLKFKEGSNSVKLIYHNPVNRSRHKMFSLPSRFLLTDIFRVKNSTTVQLADSGIGSSSSDLIPELSSSLDDQQSPSGSLRIAPFLVRNLSSESPPRRGSGNSESKMPSQVKVSSPIAVPGKGGESSWKAFCRAIKFNSENGKSSPKKKFENDLINNNTESPSPSGIKAMAMSLLLDPIIGSPPSSFTSPTVEARDDISALSEGFTRKVKLNRRRLSTSFDEPSSNDYGGGRGTLFNKAGAGGSPANIEHVGPFGLKPVGRGVVAAKKCHAEEDNAEKRAKINAWLSRVHEDALVRTRNNSSESSENSADGAGNKGYSDDDDGYNSSRSSNHGNKITEDLFQLLEKVIGFKGRNISHITVEQSVKDLCTVYMDATEDEKLKFFTILAQKYGVDHDYVTNAATNLASCTDSDVRLTLEEKLRGALVPKSQWLFTQIGRLENGVKFLVDLRTDLLDAIEKAQEKSSLKALNNSVRDLIGMWFNVGFLNLERVTWQSACDMLQKISEYEAVHPMRNWTDLKKRVGPNRRCFVFTHNSMPGEPVVVLHTFLTDHIPASVQKIVANHRMRMMSLDNDLPMSSSAEDPDSINTAAFYSITSTQKGLQGIELGNYLIKRVVRELQSEFPKMTQYSSLSPIPGFKNWLVSSIRTVMKDPTQKLFTDKEITVLKPIFANYGEGRDLYEVFLDLLKVNSWYSDDKLVKELESPLMRLCAQYLYITKRRGYALDPVGHFHLKNGAVMWRINWLGDNSPRGLGQSCGMMVNYRYFLDDCETNSQNYMENQVIKISDQVRHLVKLTDSSGLVNKL